MGFVYPLGVAGVEMDTYQHGCPVYYFSHQNQEMEETNCSLTDHCAVSLLPLSFPILFVPSEFSLNPYAKTIPKVGRVS